MRAEAGRMLGEMATTRMGVVDGYDPANYTARVRLQPEGALTGWLPIMTPRTGNRAGVYAPPNIGDQVVVGFQEADRDAGVVLGALYSDEDVPLPVPAGEVWVVLEGGATLKMGPAGVTLSMAGVSLALSAAGVAIIGGSLTHNGVNIGSTHRHSQVQAGGSNSGVPIP